MSEKIMIIGAGGNARVITDIFYCCGIEVAGYFDDKPADCFPGMNIIGSVGDAAKYPDALFIIGIGENIIRKNIADRFPSLHYTTAIHPSAVIARDVKIGAGTVIMANAVINTGSVVGRHCIINTIASVDHDNTIDDFVHISPNAVLCGTVYVGSLTLIGAGATIKNNTSVCGNCVIGAGTVVVKDVKDSGTYKGVPAKKNDSVQKRDSNGKV